MTLIYKVSILKFVMLFKNVAFIVKTFPVESNEKPSVFKFNLIKY